MAQRVISNPWASNQSGARSQNAGARRWCDLACAGIVYTLVSVRASRRYSKSPGPGAKILQNRLLGPLGGCCAKTGTIEMEEVVPFRPITPQEAKPPGSLLITDPLITDYFCRGGPSPTPTPTPPSACR